jgi:hypothetical protein
MEPTPTAQPETPTSQAPTSPNPATADKVAACVSPGAPGNALGVGKSCTKGGGECGSTSFAKICTVDVKPDAPAFCTNACTPNTDQCGDGAKCLTTAFGTGCVPDACATAGGF